MTIYNPEPHMPVDLRRALATDARAQAQWNDLTTIARRDFITWIESAKQAQTRTRRIDKACDMLIKGKRRPRCYSAVPLDLYKALADMPEAKARWSALTPARRRDLAAWVDSAQNKEEHMRRVEKACVMLVTGKGMPR